MTGTKFGCGIAQCGACTVHVDGNPVRSCLLPIGAVGDRAITTIEGIGATESGAKVQKAWLDLEVIQCGYCQSGQIMSAAALLAGTPHPDDAISTRPWREISVAAGPMCAFGRDQARRRRLSDLGGSDVLRQSCSRSLPSRSPDWRLSRRIRVRLPSSGAARRMSRIASRQYAGPV